MPEPFKNKFNTQLVTLMGARIAACQPSFDSARFEALAGRDLGSLELRQRSRQITGALVACLPQDFSAACESLLAASGPEEDGGLGGWAIMPMADFVAERGVGHFDLSMRTLAGLTPYFSSEFAVRPFIAADPDRAFVFLRAWATDQDEHVRRLASEGSRPRLPWGQRLDLFVADPAPLLPLLAGLRDDPSEYVRRSVANNLNDISKDHPHLVAGTASDWLRDAPKERERLIRHACRSLVKQGFRPAFEALGFGPAEAALISLDLSSPLVEFGGRLEFSARLRSDGSQMQNIVLDYVVHHRKANGTSTPKVFKWKQLRLAAGETVSLRRSHPMRPVTTRVYYNGAHRLEIVANGTVLGGAEFELTGV